MRLSTAPRRKGSLAATDPMSFGAPAGTSGAARSLGRSWVRRSSTDSSFTGGGSGGAAIVQHADGGEPMSALKDENRALREELSKYTGGAAGNPLIPVRRPLAAIAGGGFRGNAAQQQHLQVQQSGTLTLRSGKRCECDSLRAKLARIRSELALLQEAQGEFPRESADGYSSRFSPPVTPTCATTDKFVQTTADLMTRCYEVSVQTSSPAPEEEECLGCEAFTQTYVGRFDIATQAEVPPAATGEAAVQTQASVTEHGVQTLQPAGPRMANAQVQTADVPSEPATQVADAGVQASAPPPSTSEGFAQTSDLPGPDVVAASTQTLPQPQLQVVGTQTAAPDVKDASTMAVDDEASARERQWAKRLMRLEELNKTLEKERAILEAEIEEKSDMATVLKQALHNKALGQLNVTILCPRAECTVGVDHVEIDGWDPARLKKDFERDVLPRFTRIFVDEVAPNGVSDGRARQVMQQAMEEFADIFRERLSKMLDANGPLEAVDNIRPPAGRGSTQASPTSRARR